MENNSQMKDKCAYFRSVESKHTAIKNKLPCQTLWELRYKTGASLEDLLNAISPSLIDCTHIIQLSKKYSWKAHVSGPQKKIAIIQNPK